MIRGFATELMRSMGPKLKNQFEVQPYIPLEIKLWVERLRLADLVVARSTTKIELRPLTILPDGDDVDGGGFGERRAVECERESV